MSNGYGCGCPERGRFGEKRAEILAFGIARTVRSHFGNASSSLKRVLVEPRHFIPAIPFAKVVLPNCARWKGRANETVGWKCCFARPFSQRVQRGARRRVRQMWP